MERIVIEVKEATAKNWQKIPPNVKNQLEESFEKQIDGVSEKSKESNFERMLKVIREEAKKNGLTEETLQQLLNED
ncbi:MAG: hypothetical protein ABIW47_16465 [Ginsengibacter sp.]|jgi:hypothetical protein